MKRNLINCFLIILLLQVCYAPPVTKNKSSEPDPSENDVNKEAGLEVYMEYHRYLKEVVNALESDPQFREKLEKAQEQDIRSGKIAHELEYVSHNVRTQLDEIKRIELERLRHLANKQYEKENGLEAPKNEHLDHANPHTFEIEDLKKLIAKSTQDLAEADKERRQNFKEYEMQKEFEKQEKLKSMDEAHRAELEKQLKEREELHKKHKPLHHPGSKQQLNEVWEKQDHMEQQDFDPRTFFMLHDLDGNGVWDQDEVKTLFIKELDKMYREGAPEDDMRERIEEMERMREHVFSEVDTNKDGLISYGEFIDQTKKQDFQEDKGWETLDQQRLYTDEEYQQFERQRVKEVERLVSQGMLPPHPAGPPYYDPHMQGQGQFPPQGQFHPGQVHPGQGNVGQVHPGQVHPAQQVPQGQYHPNQPQQMQYHQGQVHPNQVNQQQYQQPPPVYQQQQPPPAQVQPNRQAVPQGNQGANINANNQPPLNTNEVYGKNPPPQVKSPQLPNAPPPPAQPVPVQSQQQPPQANQVHAQPQNTQNIQQPPVQNPQQAAPQVQQI